MARQALAGVALFGFGLSTIGAGVWLAFEVSSFEGAHVGQAWLGLAVSAIGLMVADLYSRTAKAEAARRAKK